MNGEERKVELWMLDGEKRDLAPVKPDSTFLFQSNEELDAMADEEERALLIEGEEVLDSLTLYVRKCWEAARDHRRGGGEDSLERRMVRCLRQRTGIHDPEILAARQAEGKLNTVYMMLTDEKCSALESWLEDLLLPVNDKPWGVAPTPVPDLAPQILEQAHGAVVREIQKFLMKYGRAYPEIEEDAQKLELETADRIRLSIARHAEDSVDRVEAELDDVLEEAGWRSVFMEFLGNFATYPVAYMKGVVLRRKPVLEWDETGMPRAVTGEVREYDAPSPFDIYPSPTSRGIDDGYLVERHVLTRDSLYSLIGVEGYDEDAIREVLEKHSLDGYSRTWLWEEQSERDELEGRGRSEDDPEPRIDALQFWGNVMGSDLLGWQGSKKAGLGDLDPERSYSVEVWLIDQHVISAVLNPEPLGRKPYYKASFREVPGSFIGKALPEVIRDSQIVCNSTMMNLLDNMAIASGPQVGVDVGAMPEGADYTVLYPWQIWLFDLQSGPNQGTPRNPLWFFQPELHSRELLDVYEKFSAEADSKSGIPKYSYGHKESGGPLGTATGFSMMMNNAARGIKKVVRNIDYGIIVPLIDRLYLWLAIHDERFRSIHKGDIKILARGSSAMVAKEQVQMRRVEVLQLLLQSEDLKALVGLPGVAEVFRMVLDGVGIDVSAMPSDLEIKGKVAMMEEHAREQAAREAMASEGAPAGEGAGAAMPGPVQGRIPGHDGHAMTGQDVASFQGVR